MTLVCSNGTVNSNSFLLSSIFPVVRKTMETTIQYRDPDMDMMDLETFLQHLQEHHSSFKISNNVEEVYHFEDIAENYCDRDTNNEMNAKTNRKDNLKTHVYRWHIAPRIVFVKNKTCQFTRYLSNNVFISFWNGVFKIQF